jgi:hypothetical protein
MMKKRFYQGEKAVAAQSPQIWPSITGDFSIVESPHLYLFIPALVKNQSGQPGYEAPPPSGARPAPGRARLYLLVRDFGGVSAAALFAEATFSLAGENAL